MARPRPRVLSKRPPGAAGRRPPRARAAPGDEAARRFSPGPGAAGPDLRVRFARRATPRGPHRPDLTPTGQNRPGGVRQRPGDVIARRRPSVPWRGRAGHGSAPPARAHTPAPPMREAPEPPRDAPDQFPGDARPPFARMRRGPARVAHLSAHACHFGRRARCAQRGLRIRRWSRAPRSTSRMAVLIRTRVTFSSDLRMSMSSGPFSASRQAACSPRMESSLSPLGVVPGPGTCWPSPRKRAGVPAIARLSCLVLLSALARPAT